ncbi:MAG: hypothetical protein NUV50_04705 [Rhodospirillales bacterium]|nr:hypothetical protein [Rhodospirillales bacterium]
MRLRLLFVVLAAALMVGALFLHPPLWVYPAVFALIFLFYANTFSERVPLYLSNRTTWAALALVLDGETIAVGRRPAFVDLGCGLGGTLAYLARARPDWDIVGVETAPGPYLIAKARTAFLPNAQVRFQTLWKTNLAAFDVVYAFLSPVPMPKLHAKVAAEMRPGTLFVSNSFWADGQPYDGVIEVNDTRSTRLIFSKK